MEEEAARLMENFSGQVGQNPAAYPQLLTALDFALGPSSEIVLAGTADDPVIRQMIQPIYRQFLPNKVVALHPPGEAGRAIEGLVPFLEGQGMVDGRPAAYLCRNYTCDLPTTIVEELKKLLEESP